MPVPHTIEHGKAKASFAPLSEKIECNSPIKVVIVGDNHIVRSGLGKILEGEASICVQGEITVKQATAESISNYSPDLILIDLDSRGADALGLIRSLRDRFEALAILVMIELEAHELALQALTVGAAGIVLKLQPPGVLVAAIRELFPVSQHSSTPVNRIGDRTPNTHGKTLIGVSGATITMAKVHSLTGREREIISLIGHGLKNKEIANRLSISDITVRHHLTSIFCKLEVEDRQKLLILAHRYGLIDLSFPPEPH
jgi:DNA-binding NarL/FixJ family response regulator